MSKLDQNKLIEALASQSGGKISGEQVKSALKGGNISDLVKKLSPDDQAKLNAALQDKNTLSKLLANEESRRLIHSFLKGGAKNG